MIANIFADTVTGVVTDGPDGTTPSGYPSEPTLVSVTFGAGLLAGDPNSWKVETFGSHAGNYFDTLSFSAFNAAGTELTSILIGIAYVQAIAFTINGDHGHIVGYDQTFQLPGTSTTPLPAALPLMASGLGVLGFLANRRKRKATLAA
jgi:hypothetical protein